ncbi:MAG: Oxygen-independent coproporphyrinogen-III oxidase-like protein YqeR [Firmicutes bacterium]|nr:Oxygen-independent coproporphyrinogen-III oxidase-like protein YqeR [Bacillota bacterium]
MRGLYVHVPFCLGKCLYCDFYSLPHEEALEEAFLSALRREIVLKGGLWGGPAHTLYFGGGTPSILRPHALQTIISLLQSYFPLPSGAEVTLEVNPATFGSLDFGLLRDIGINRISIGLQSSSPRHLAMLGRRHNMTEFDRTVALAKEAGITNFSVDALYGLPEQDVSDYLETLACIVQSGAVHISSYALQVEPSTPLAEMVKTGALIVPADDIVAEMMHVGKAYLESQGFVHYEISNFARLGFAGQHNMLYWHNREYLGFGPAAASYIGKRRFSGVPDLQSYIGLLATGRLVAHSCEAPSLATEMAETVMLGLRLLDAGVSRPAFEERFSRDVLDVYAEPVATLVKQGLLSVHSEALLLTPRAFPLASQVQMAFLP